jgi:hypothetical protein
MYLFCDTETRSELNIKEVGAYRYVFHPSTELLMTSYMIDDQPMKRWETHTSGFIPEDLKEALEDPFTIIVAWNGVGFERLVFKRFFGMDISVDRFEDPMFRSRYMSMPGKLEKVGKILDIKSKKLTEFFIKDESMVDMFCAPLRFGGELTLFGIEPTTYRDWDTHRKEWDRFGQYCDQDVYAMKEIMGRVQDFPLTDFEYEVIALDARINDRGIYTDSVLLQGAGIIVEKEQASLLKEFREISGISNPKAPKQVLAFVRQHGYTFPSIGKPFVKRALNGECELDALGKRVLELRLQVSKSSVAKLESCKNSVMPDGRVRGLFNYMGAARTGRWTSGLFQAHNLIKATKEVEKKFDLAMELLKAGNYDTIKKEFSSPLDVACSALRPILRAAPGKKFVIADLAAIESRGQFWVAGCDSGMEEFRKGLDPYISFAVLMDPSKTYEELYADFKAGNKKTRTDAKAPKLGCFGKDTPVLTNRGWTPITEVSVNDLLWDGEDWVSHSGVIYQGEKKVIDLFGVEATPDHKILTEDGWKDAKDVVQDTLLGQRDISLVTGLLKEEKSELAKKENTNSTISACAKNVESKRGSIDLAWRQEKQTDAYRAPTGKSGKRRTEYTFDLADTLENLLTDLQTDTTQSSLGAEELDQKHIDMVEEVSDASLKMFMILWGTASLSKTTISQSIKSTEKIMTEITKKGIFDLLQASRIIETKKSFATSNITEKESLRKSSGRSIAHSTEKAALSQENSRKVSPQKGSLQNSLGVVVPTFDILNSGPKSRFTILTNKGPLIVHNCGFGLSAGDIDKDDEGNVVKTGLLAYAEAMQIELTKEYAEKSVEVFRRSYKEVVDYWYDLHRAFANVVENDSVVTLGPVKLEMQGRVLCIWLPSGRALHYINPYVERVERVSKKGNTYQAVNLYCAGVHPETHQWVPDMETRGAKIFENIVQAICRDILAYGMIRAEDRGFPIVLSCHDEICAEVDEDSPLGVKELVEDMTEEIPWAPGFILGAEGFTTPYYTKQ